MTIPPPPRSVSREEYDARVADLMREDVLLARVRDVATLLGWLSYHTHDSRRSEPGFPDLVLVHPTRRRLIFAELKRQKPRPTPKQEEWLDALREVADDAVTFEASRRYREDELAGRDPDRDGALRPIEVHLWRPSDWLNGTIEATLR